MSRLQQHLSALTSASVYGHLKGIRRGIEKESLRITPDGRLSQTPHSTKLGSALAHPEITTDFSESLLEFITEPHASVDALLTQLNNIHHFTYQSLGEEMLWINSMPCSIPGDDFIPVAEYGSSNVAKMKTIYRLGLGHRYGRLMQTIAGIHYNFSLPDDFWRFLQEQEKNQQALQDYKTQRYFDLIRNFRRYFWLLIYLFGASPAVCRSFVKGREHSLIPFGKDTHTLHSPFATSLRMGDLGYQSTAQNSISVNYNNLPDYLLELCQAITKTHPEYADIGIQDSDGNYKQLNAGILQIENEFYSTIRPKRAAHSGETALGALHDRGVEYIEVRCVDLNPYEPLGINADQVNFLDTFLVYCLLADSPLSNEQEYKQVQENQQKIVYHGRDPELTLSNHKKNHNFREWAQELLAEMNDVACLLDSARETNDHARAVTQAQEKILNPSLTPSAKILADLRENDQTFYQFSFHQAQQHAQHFRANPMDTKLMASYREIAEQSLVQQKIIESQQQLDFETYLKNFYRQYRHCSEQRK